MNPLIEPRRAYTFLEPPLCDSPPSFRFRVINRILTCSFLRSLVSFGPKQRAIGEAAKTLETSNYKNTIGSLKRLVGRSLSDPDVSETEKQFINAQLVDIDGSVGVKVSERKISRPIA